MTRSFYGNRMFIADLIIVTIWAFFFSRYCSTILLLLIPIRIALCFEMQRKSPWTIISAIGFLLAYICAGCFSKPFERMFYNFFCAIGESELMIDIFSQQLEWEMKAWIGSISALWFLWLATLPAIIGIKVLNKKKIQWNRIWIWLYLILLGLPCVWIMFEVGEIGAVLLGIVISTVPILYWCIFERQGRSPIQLALNDRNIVWYMLYVAYMLAVVTIGLRDIFSMKLIGLLVFPPLFYVMLSRSLQLGPVLTRCCIALTVSGVLYWLTLDNNKTVSIIMLIVAATLIVYAGAIMKIRSKRWTASIALIIVVPTVIIPFTLGLNPYIILDADNIHMYTSNLSVRQGVYVVDRYTETTDKSKPYYWCRMYGLRDRYGLLLPMEYDELKVMDGWGRYISTNHHVRYGYLKSDQRYGVFDLRKREFVVNPNSLEVTDIEKIDDNSFKLVNIEGRHFATLYLPGEYRGIYFSDAHIEPHFAEGEITVNEFIGRYNNPNELYEGAYSPDVTAQDLSALRLLVLMAEFGGDNPSPANELNFGRAIKKIIDETPYYKGDFEKAFEDVVKLRKTIDADPEGIIEPYLTILLRMAKIKTAIAYNDAMMTEISDNKLILTEYIAWHNLMESMEHYLDYLYSFESERPESVDKEMIIINWYDQRRESLKKDREIMSGKLIYALDTYKAESLKSNSDYLEFFSNFHSYSKPFNYHPMWNEVKIAFDQWLDVREAITEQLEPHASLSYREYTKEVVDNFFSYIEGLDWPGFSPAL